MQHKTTNEIKKQINKTTEIKPNNLVARKVVRDPAKAVVLDCIWEVMHINLKKWPTVCQTSGAPMCI